MLSFILGRAASGKTTKVYNLIAEDIKKNVSDIILLVPEQFSFETERALLGVLGGEASSGAEVLSFSRLVDLVGRKYGGIAGVRVSDWDKIILMGQALKQVKGSLTVFKKYAGSTEFAKAMISMLFELKTAAISCDDLSKASALLEEGSLKRKVDEIALIYATYDGLLSGAYLDSDDDMKRLLDKCLAGRFFTGKTVYIDAFKGFTGAQLKLIDCILRDCKDVTITLTADSLTDEEDGLGVFSNVKEIGRTIIRLAKGHSVPVAEPFLLQKSYYLSKELAHLEKELFKLSPEPYLGQASNITVCRCETPLDELHFTFQTIHRLVREEGYRFKDFVVIARDISKYERRIETISSKFDVPCFLDKRKSIIFSPLAKYVISALEAAPRLSTEKILVHLKTGLSDLNEEEISELENYVYIWNVDGDGWTKQWNMNPDGLTISDDEKMPDLEARLAKLNELRLRAIGPLFTLRAEMHDSSKSIAESVFRMLNKQKIDETLRRYTDTLTSDGLFDDADFCRQSWDSVMEILDGFVRCIKDDTITVKEFTELFKMALSASTIGNIPRMLDEVSCGSADRIRPARPKVVFVIGLNQNEFPSRVSDDGLLLQSDRKRLTHVGLELPDRFRQFSVDENFLAYSSLCCATEKVFVCYKERDPSGAKYEPSVLVQRVINAIPNCSMITESILKNTKGKFIETEEDAFQQLSSRYQSNQVLTESLKQYFNNQETYQKKLVALERTAKMGELYLKPDTAAKLFPGDIRLSPTRIDTFHRCKFSYFCKYVLNIKKMQKADLDVLQRGTIVHYVLENMIKEYGKKISVCEKSVLNAKVDELMERYVDSVAGGEYLKTPRFLFLYGSIAGMLKELVAHLALEFLQSEFRPEFCEMVIGTDGVIPNLKVPLDDGKSVVLGGSIDRVDIFETGNTKYIRVVDYKTGKKEFRLPDVLYGLNLQMLLYLYAVIKGGKEVLGETEPAGILYMPSKRKFAEETPDASALCMNGMLLSDDIVLSAMEKDGGGQFVPTKPKRERQSDPMIGREDFSNLFSYMDLLLKRMGKQLCKGDISVSPLDGLDSEACKYCDFSAACRIEKGDKIAAVEKQSSRQVLDLMKERMKDGI